MTTIEWFQSKGFIHDGTNWCIAWSHRSGFDFTDLEFYPLQRHADDEGWDAIVGCHASGSNPRINIGRCETLADIELIYAAIKHINGYPSAEAEEAEWQDAHPVIS